MICLTGVPGTGKSTLGSILAEAGFKVCDAASVAIDSGCISGDEVDIQCLLQRGDFSRCDIVQSHFSHLLSCEHIVILETDPDVLKKRLKDRGYSESKIMENTEAQISGTIYYESLDRVPSGRITRIDTTACSPESSADTVISIFQGK